MLRPATPLTVLLFVAFALLLISVLSTPIIKGIPLSSFKGVNFGVFGYCKDGQPCSGIEIGYDTKNLLSADDNATFDLPDGTRHTLSAILIVHPIAALFTLIMLGMAGAAHFHSPSHSPRYLLGIFVLSLATFIVALLAFLIDVLLFVPHLSWGSYLVLAATILIAASGIVSCAMRRTLVGRKARKRRIAENAEMNGDNFYNRQGGPDPIIPTTTASNPLVNGGPGVDKLPAFATFEMQKEKERTSDERIPLTQRTPSETSPSNLPPSVGSDRYGGTPARSQSRGSPPRDKFGNPMPQPPPGTYGMRSRDPSRDPSLNRQYSDPAMRGRGMPPGGYRGRGGYPQNGRGGYGGPTRGGGYPQRGGYNGPPRGGYGGPYRGGMSEPLSAGGMAAGGMMRGGRGGPPPSYGPPQSGGYRGQSPGGDYARRPSPPQAPGYDAANYPPPAPPAGQYAAYNPDDSRSSLPRAESPPPMGPVGQAVEMDATTGSPSHAPKGYGQFGSIRESDGDVAGMVGLQQQRIQRETIASESSRYSQDEPYVPPRQAWGDAGRSSPLNPASQPAEVPNPKAHRRTSSAGDNYYEDVDPRFADPLPATSSLLPPALTPAGGAYPLNTSSGSLQPIGGIDGNNSYEDIQSGARSPAESDRSNFTSVSQRGINPRWNPGPGQGYGGPMPNRRPNPPQQQRDLLLNSNPDFELPTGRGRGGSAARGRMPGAIPGMVPNSAYPGSSAL